MFTYPPDGVTGPPINLNFVISFTYQAYEIIKILDSSLYSHAIRVAARSRTRIQWPNKQDYMTTQTTHESITFLFPGHTIVWENPDTKPKLEAIRDQLNTKSNIPTIS